MKREKACKPQAVVGLRLRSLVQTQVAGFWTDGEVIRLGAAAQGIRLGGGRPGASLGPQGIRVLPSSSTRITSADDLWKS